MEWSEVKAMLKIISTHVFLPQRLHAGLLEALAASGADGLEIFAARQHFDYSSRAHVKELAGWFQSNSLKPFSMHMPLFTDADTGRSGALAVNVVHPDKSRRIDAMDEVKRALEAAEEIPIQFAVLHLGEKQDTWSQRTLEHAITAIEHLHAFARPLGVGLLLENIPNEVTQPLNLLEILSTGHFTDVGICMDIGHAHFGEGVRAVLEHAKPRIVTAHIHDNQGLKDEHLWPGEGTVNWAETMEGLAEAPGFKAGVLEIRYQDDPKPDAVAKRAAETFSMLAEVAAKSSQA